MAAIRAEQETQSRAMQTQKLSLEAIIADLKTLRFAGKDKEEKDDETSSARATPLPDGTDDSVAGLSAGPLARATSSFGAQSERMSMKGNDDDDASPRNTDGSKEDDIEMGEVEEEDEEPRDKSPKKKARDEELEEGEASDFGSDLSDPPDD
jgi:THO complex subunit 7